MKSKLLSNIEQFLNSPKGCKKSYIRTFLVALLVIAISAIVLALIIEFGPGATNPYHQATELYKNLNKSDVISYVSAAKNLTYAAFAMLGVPFLVLFTFWIIGINQTSKSKYYHLFMWFIIFVALLLAVIAMILFIRSGVTNFNNFA